MQFILKDQGKSYTPSGHDAEVVSRSIYKKALDIHETTFPPKAGMRQEIHEHESHVFVVLEGEMDVLQDNTLIQVLNKNDAVYIPAGERHEIRNVSDSNLVFLAITFPEENK